MGAPVTLVKPNPITGVDEIVNFTGGGGGGGDATAANQVTGNNSLATIAAKDFATQTTLAALNGKDFSTSAKQDTGNTSLTAIAAKDFATQTTLAALNGKDFATSAKQDTGNTSLSTIAGKDFATQTTLAAVLTSLNAATPAGTNKIGGVTIADGDNSAQGAKADAAYTGTGAASVIAILKGAYAALVAATPAGSAIIGKVGIDQTTPGTTNLVAAGIADGSDAATGAKADTAYAGTGSASVIGILKGVYAALTAALTAGTNQSGSITTGGTAQTLAASNTARKTLTGQNISAADLWINETGGTAAADTAGSYKVTAGSMFRISTNRAISIFGATTGQKFTATET